MVAFKDIAGIYDIKLISLTDENLKKYSKIFSFKRKDVLNNAYLIDDDTIILGIFSDREHMIAAFFHELGHLKISECLEKQLNNNFLIESLSWVNAIKIAKKFGYEFNENMHNYLISCTKSYYEKNISK